MDQILAIFRDVPKFLTDFVGDHGPWVYALLFAIIFAETGLVVMPFLPGDSLLFAVGALCAPGAPGADGVAPAPILNLWIVLGLLIAAGIIGDAVNYHVGKFVGPRVFSKSFDPKAPGVPLVVRLLNRKHLDRAHEFFEKYGGKAVVLGRFVPIVRTFVPFVAGAGAMTYSKFVFYNVTGAVLWVGVCVMAGYFFGNIPIVRKNFELVVVGIIIVSLVPIGVEWYLHRKRSRLLAGGAVES